MHKFCACFLTWNIWNLWSITSTWYYHRHHIYVIFCITFIIQSMTQTWYHHVCVIVSCRRDFALTDMIRTSGLLVWQVLLSLPRPCDPYMHGAQRSAHTDIHVHYKHTTLLQTSYNTYTCMKTQINIMYIMRTYTCEDQPMKPNPYK